MEQFFHKPEQGDIDIEKLQYTKWYQSIFDPIAVIHDNKWIKL